MICEYTSVHVWPIPSRAQERDSGRSVRCLCRSRGSGFGLRATTSLLVRRLLLSVRIGQTGARTLADALGTDPLWTYDSTIGYKMINARSETVAAKPSFREPLRRQRCLIPADGFYEWKREGKQKLPFCFTLASDSVFAFAGIWDRWKSPLGQSIESCSILTTTPNELMQDIHDRMPVILSPDAYDIWLDPGLRNVEELQPLLKPYPPESCAAIASARA